MFLSSENEDLAKIASQGITSTKELAEILDEFADRLEKSDEIRLIRAKGFLNKVELGSPENEGKSTTPNPPSITALIEESGSEIKRRSIDALELLGADEKLIGNYSKQITKILTNLSITISSHISQVSSSQGRVILVKRKVLSAGGASQDIKSEILESAKKMEVNLKNALKEAEYTYEEVEDDQEFDQVWNKMQEDIEKAKLDNKDQTADHTQAKIVNELREELRATENEYVKRMREYEKEISYLNEEVARIKLQGELSKDSIKTFGESNYMIHLGNYVQNDQPIDRKILEKDREIDMYKTQLDLLNQRVNDLERNKDHGGLKNSSEYNAQNKQSNAITFSPDVQIF